MAAVCRNCGDLLPYSKVLCRKCGHFTPNDGGSLIGSVSKAKTTTLDQVAAETVARATVGEPWDECWGGGGIVWASSTLVGGPPGSGKTTGMIQILSKLAELTGRRSYMLSAEQSPGDIRITAERLCIPNIDRFRVLSEFGVGADVDEELLKEDPPAAFLVDSVSALVGKDAHAGIAIAKTYKKLAIKHKAPAFIICHMTKEHDFAGLMALQHEVDTLVTIFPEDDGSRHMKPWKNRFGPTHGEYKLIMTPRGLVGAPKKQDKKARHLHLVPDLIDEAPEPLPRVRQVKKESPDSIEVGGQKLVKKVKKDKKDDRAKAIEGEALKKKRPAMPKVKKAKPKVKPEKKPGKKSKPKTEPKAKLKSKGKARK